MSCRLAVALLVLSACDQEPRSLSVVEEDGSTEASPKPVDTDEPESSDPVLNEGCGADITYEEGDLALLGCTRLSPEPGDWTGDTGATDSGTVDTGLPPPGAPPPCGYFNLIGAVDMAGDPTSPDVLYCDADDDGGLRLARWAVADGALERTTLLDDTCWVDFMTGQLTGAGEERRAWWVQLATVDDTSVWTTRLSEEGGFAETPIPVDGTEGARRVVVVEPEGSTRLVLHEMDGTIAMLDPSTGARAEIAGGVWTFGAGEAGPGVVVASCDEETLSLTVTGLDAAGEIAWSRAVADASCGFLSNPAVSGDADRVVVSWDDAEEGDLLILDAAGETVAQHGLGKSSVFPVSTLLDGAIWTVDGSGAVTRWSREGEQEASWEHRGIGRALGSVVGLRFSAAEGGLVFTLIGQDAVTTSTGHVYTYYYLETSASALPTP